MSPVGPRGHTPSSAAINSAPTQENASLARPPHPPGHTSFSQTLAFWSYLLPFVIPWFGLQEWGVKLRDSFTNTETKSRNRAISLSLASTEFSTFLSLLKTPWPEAAVIYLSSYFILSYLSFVISMLTVNSNYLFMLKRLCAARNSGGCFADP